MNFTIKRWLSYLLLFLAQVTIGFNITGAKYLLTEQLTPAFILLWRFLIASVLLFGMYAVFSRRDQRLGIGLRAMSRRDWIFAIMQALCAGALFNCILFTGLRYTTVSHAGIITSMLPAIIMIMSVIFLRERLTLPLVLCVLFSIFGLLVINLSRGGGGGFHINAGDLIILLSLLPEGLYYVLAARHIPPLPIFLLSALMNAINVPIILLVWMVAEPVYWPHLSVVGYWVLAVTSITTALFYVFWFLGCQKVAGSIAGVFTAVVPLSSLTLAALFLHEVITGKQLMGMLLVMIAIGCGALRRSGVKVS